MDSIFSNMLAALKSAISWFFITYISPSLIFMFASALALFTDWGQWVLIKLSNWGIDRAENLIFWMKDIGVLPEVGFGTIPPEYSVLLGHLRIPECVGIIMTALAVRFFRVRLMK